MLMKSSLHKCFCGIAQISMEEYCLAAKSLGRNAYSCFDSINNVSRETLDNLEIYCFI